MSAFYTMQYHGQTGFGLGALYIGRGRVVGADAAGASVASSDDVCAAASTGSCARTGARLRALSGHRGRDRNAGPASHGTT